MSKQVKNMDSNPNDEDTDIAESSSQLIDKSSSAMVVNGEKILSSTTEIAISSELDLKRKIEKTDNTNSKTMKIHSRNSKFNKIKMI